MPEAAVLLGFDATVLNSRLRLLPNGKLIGENVPGVLVGKAKGSLFSANGSWHVATDQTASVVLEFDVAGGQLSSALDVLEKASRIYIAAWLDEPGGTPLMFQRITTSK